MVLVPALWSERDLPPAGDQVFSSESVLRQFEPLTSVRLCVRPGLGAFVSLVGAACFCGAEVESDASRLCEHLCLSTSQIDGHFSVPLNLWVKKLINMSVWIYSGSSRPAGPVEEK